MARDHQAATGIGQLAATFVAGVIDPAAEKARHKCIASAQHIEHFHTHTRVDRAVFQARRNRTVDDRAPLRP